MEFLKELVNTPSPSGYEEKVAEVYRQYTGGPLGEKYPMPDMVGLRSDWSTPELISSNRL